MRPYLVLYTIPKVLWLLPATLGSVILFVATGKLLRYFRDVMSANIYETGVIYDYPEDFDENDHTYFSVGCCPEQEEESLRTRLEGRGAGIGGLGNGHKGEGPKGGGRRTHKEELNILRHFVRNAVIPNFEDQRDSIHGGNHFTVLILLENSLTSLSENWAFKPLTSEGTPYVDSRYPTYPPRNIYENYVVARPQLHRVSKILRRILFYKVPEIYYEHAEVMLLNEFDTLCEMFEASRRCKTKVIILFSWLFPCQRCTSKLVEKFGQKFRMERPAVQRVILVFAVFWCRMPFEENWKNFERLKNNSFDVVRVKI